ncbi:type II toxin-antitoxin system VapC family toxin [Sphingomonas gilva]|uniref:Type II toxin-antitoxin system VapC family toxin n=1 Tax=Sphingomonas gilva TaxID=2305907 RepID=A0A396RRX6_9SPHN|nr:PIN domain-containing protein [Sphingomonas gilva]RHW18082.1 type II toxin-antitoxin system VapC family toxin [Sphingomonas gilva]
MADLVDTNIAIYLRDSNPVVLERMAGLDGRPFISIVTLVELEGGAAHSAASSEHRRRIDELLSWVDVLPFGMAEAVEYGHIVQSSGYNRSRLLDRMIAAQAIAAGARLITINGKDFTDIPGLNLEVWPAP